MNAIKEARQIITTDPNGEESPTLARLVLALESEDDFLLPASTRLASAPSVLRWKS